MKSFKKSKKLLLLAIVLFGLFVLTGCQKNVDANGVTLPERIIYLTSPWKDATNEGVLSAVLVWPLAQCINWLANLLHSPALGVIVTTILFTVITLPLSIKSTVSSQKIQILQPELQKIQAKYEGKTDDASRMQQADEMNKLYSKHGINPIGSLVTPFLQFPILFAMFYAVQRADAVVNGKLFGVEMSGTPLNAFKNFSAQWPIAIVFILMVASQFISSKIPSWLAEKKRKSAKNYKKYADQGNPQAASQNGMVIGMIGLVAVMGLRWPIAMSVYWLINSVANILKTLFIQWRYIDNE